MVKEKAMITFVVSIIAAFALGIFISDLLVPKDKIVETEAAAEDSEDTSSGLSDIAESPDIRSETTFDNEGSEEQDTDHYSFDPDDYRPEIDWEAIADIGKKAGKKAVRLGKSALNSGIKTGRKVYDWIKQKID